MSKRHLHSVIKRLQAEIDMQSNIEPCRFNIMCPKSTEENHCRLIMVVIPLRHVEGIGSGDRNALALRVQ
jgi:hypothetical protein